MPAMLLKRLALSCLLMPTAAVNAADYACEGLVPTGDTLICSGFEPNWAIELSCDGASLSANFIDAFSGATVVTTPGTASFTSQSPWTFTTSHGVAGSIAYTPDGCTDESDARRDFTFTAIAAPGLSGPFFPFCCRFR